MNILLVLVVALNQGGEVSSFIVRSCGNHNLETSFWNSFINSGRFQPTQAGSRHVRRLVLNNTQYFTGHYIDRTLLRQKISLTGHFFRQDISQTVHFIDRTLLRQVISSTEHVTDRTFQWQDISQTGHFIDRVFLRQEIHRQDISLLHCYFYDRRKVIFSVHEISDLGSILLLSFLWIVK